MVCGLLTGTCFGFNLYDIQVPFFQTLKETISLDNQQMFNLSLILGGVQIIFGMILKAVNQTIQFWCEVCDCDYWLDPDSGQYGSSFCSSRTDGNGRNSTSDIIGYRRLDGLSV